jgi:hypothetical protein
VRLLGLLALSACGRIDFDARHVPGDSAVAADMMLSLAHDEDGDGIPDADDPCPHVAGTTADGDGDGVGDDCDVNPSTPSEHWVLFSTMQTGDEPFDDITGFAQEADALRVATDVGPNVNISFVRARIDVGWTINAVVGTGQHQLAFGFDDTMMSNSAYYFNELNENGTTRDAAIVSYDATNGYQMVSAMDPGALHAGPGVSRVDVAPGSINAVLGWLPAQMYSVGAGVAGYAHCDHLRFSLHGLDVSIRYVAIITSS